MCNGYHLLRMFLTIEKKLFRNAWGISFNTDKKKLYKLYKQIILQHEYIILLTLYMVRMQKAKKNVR